MPTCGNRRQIRLRGTSRPLDPDVWTFLQRCGETVSEKFRIIKPDRRKQAFRHPWTARSMAEDQCALETRMRSRVGPHLI